MTDLDELTGNKYQYSIGLRHRRDNVLFTFGFTENVPRHPRAPQCCFGNGRTFVVPKVRREC